MKKFLGNFGNSLLVGALLLAPLAITVWVVTSLFGWLTGWFVHIVPVELQAGWTGLLMRVAALALVVAFVFVIGLLVRNYVGRTFYEFMDRVLSNIPGVKLFYNFFRQIIEVFFASKGSSFKEVVLIEYPRAGTFMLGFVTSTVPARFAGAVPQTMVGDELVSVFIPMTPLPSSGWFAIVPRSQLVPMGMSPAEGMKLVVSGGAIYPGDAEEVQTSLLEKLEARAKRKKERTTMTNDPIQMTNDPASPGATPGPANDQ